MAHEPLVSAIVTSYNHERTVVQAVESALAQEVDDLEVIVVDDASTDRSQRLLEPFAREPRMRLVLHEANRGISATFNHGLALARGRFVAYLGSDDFWLPTHLRDGVESLTESGAAMGYARVRLVDGEGRDVIGSEPPFDAVPDDAFFVELLKRGNFVPFISAVLRRDVVLAVGGFDERLVTLQDYDLWLRIAAGHPVRFRDETVGGFRWDGCNTSAPSAENSLRYRRESFAILERCLREQAPALRRVGVEREVRRRIAASHRREGRRVADPAARARCFRRSLRWELFQPVLWLRCVGASLRAALGEAREAPPPAPRDARPGRSGERAVAARRWSRGHPPHGA